jgi:hypothetical protein
LFDSVEDPVDCIEGYEYTDTNCFSETFCQNIDDATCIPASDPNSPSAFFVELPDGDQVYCDDWGDQYYGDYWCPEDYEYIAAGDYCRPLNFL